MIPVVAQAFRQVFAEVRYTLLAVTTGLAIFIFATWLANLALVWQIAASKMIPLSDKLNVLVALTGSIATNFTLFSALTTVLIAALFGANVAMIAYHLRLRRESGRQAGQAAAATSLGGLASGLFGVGCAACGTFLLSPALALLGVASLIPLLPFGGEEFGLLGVGMLGVSLAITARKIVQPVACPIPTRGIGRTSLPR